jgi:hypothetical protein
LYTVKVNILYILITKILEQRSCDAMVRWTEWRKLANKKYWYDYELDYDGPACYELGIGGPNYGGIRPVYVGETANERKRLSNYARHGSHLSHIIDDCLRNDWTLYYRAVALPSKDAAIDMQGSLLKKYRYDWNYQLNMENSDH